MAICIANKGIYDYKVQHHHLHHHHNHHHHNPPTTKNNNNTTTTINNNNNTTTTTTNNNNNNNKNNNNNIYNQLYIWRGFLAPLTNELTFLASTDFGDCGKAMYLFQRDACELFFSKPHMQVIHFTTNSH